MEQEPPAIPPAQAEEPPHENTPEEDVHMLLERVGITVVAKRNIMIQVEGFRRPTDFGIMQLKDVGTMVKRLTSRSRDEDRVIMGIVVIKRFEALTYWVRDKIRRNKEVIAADFTEQAMEKAVKAVTTLKLALDNEEMIDLVKFDKDKWDDARESLENKLAGTYGANDAPLNYITREEVPDDYAYNDQQELLKYELVHEGQAYEVDNHHVYRILKEWLAGTDGWTHIKKLDRAQDGRKAFQALVAFYEGEGENIKRVSTAKAQIDSLHYRSEQAFSFNQYVTRFKEAFQQLDKDEDEQLTGKQQVEYLLKGMKDHSDGRVQNLIPFARDKHPRDFDKCANYLSGEITHIYPSAADKKTRFKRKIGKTGKGGGRGGGRGGKGRSGGRGGRGGSGRNGPWRRWCWIGNYY